MTTTTRAGLSLGLGTALLAALVASAASGAFAQNTGNGSGLFMQERNGPPQGGRFGGPGGSGGPGAALGALGPMMRRLNLNDAQQEQIRGILDSHRDEIRAMSERNRPAHEALHQAVTADNFDEGTIRARSAEVAAADVEMAVLQARIYSEAVRVLTPDQRTQLKTLQAEMKERGPGRGRGARGPQ
jgi:Spy/CpxP family protein refolding chaperone